MRRIIAIAASIASIGIGTLLLAGYVRGAEERALAGEELVGVLVLDEPVGQGEPSDALAGNVRMELVPAKVRTEGAVGDLSVLSGLVASVDLLPGEQVTESRFVDPATLAVYVPAEPPPGTIEVTLSLSPERALGGRLAPGATVSLFASFDPIDVSAAEPGATGEIETFDADGNPIYVGSTGDEANAPRTPNSTHLILQGLLVTNVQVEQLPPAGEDGAPGETPALAPTGNLLVTLAAVPADAEKIVFTAEHGFVWLANETDDVVIGDTEIQTRETIYR